MDTKHTPTPWTAELYMDGAFDIVTEKVFGGCLVLASRQRHMTRSEEMHANAAFICLAVNSHEQLVEALTNLLDAVADTMRSHEKELECCSVTRVRMIEARAALASVSAK
jgi:hypothetical protein